MHRVVLFFFFSLCFVFAGIAQDVAIVYGNVADNAGKPISDALVMALGTNAVARTKKDGSFELSVKPKSALTIKITCLGFKDGYRKLDTLLPKQRVMVNMRLEEDAILLKTQTISETKSDNNFQKMNLKTVSAIPVASGDGIMGILKTYAGVHSNNELSSQYSVRGGNYDENLVYVNDIEIYRPFLVRSGQQEGLSFVNSDMVGAVNFSAGGFEAKYGDKMSSVLDVRYKRPDKFASSVSASLLGGSAQVEGSADSNRFTYMIGIRNKTNQYVLSKLATKGDYKPSYMDVQSVFIYDLSKKWQLSFLGGYSRNKYLLVPDSMVSSFGTVKQAMQLRVFFDGKEIDQFSTLMGALSADYNWNSRARLKFVSSIFNTQESETYDIQGEYWLDELDVDFGKDNFGKVAYNRGVGAYMNHARNYLDATIYNFEQKGYYNWKAVNLLQWGLKYQHEQVLDRMSEWNLIDSADYNLPVVTDSVGYINPFAQPKASLEMQNVVKKINSLNSDRYSAYLQNVWVWTYNKGELSVNGGARANYWNINKQLLVSPRVVISYKPFIKKDIVYRLSSGLYYQPPFYREMRDFQGNLNLNLKAQESIHILAGMDYNFKAWHRPFKLTTEAYYKYLDNLVTYEVDNVRIRYYANNMAKGYVKGIDFKVNGEFVRGVESWASVSLMKTQEDLKNDFYYTYLNQTGAPIVKGITIDDKATDSIRHEPGYIPRPTDQRISVNIFFQDYLPIDSTFKMHLNLVFATGLPFGPPSMDRYKDTLSMPSYRRVDIGFSKLLKSEKKVLPKSNPLHYFKSIWASFEVFNLLQINNTISYLWIKDVSNRQYAIPSYLTPRMLNIRIIAKF